MNIQEIERLRLHPIDDEMRLKLDQYYDSIDAPLTLRDYSLWQLVHWHQGHPFFYSKKYVEEVSLEEFTTAWTALIQGIEG